MRRSAARLAHLLREYRLPLTNDEFARRVRNIADAMGLKIKSAALESIATDVSADLEKDAASSAVAQLLKEIRLARPYAFATADESDGGEESQS